MVLLLFWCILVLHVAMSISFPWTCYFLVFIFMSYFNSFVVWLWRFSFLCIFVMIFFLYFFYLPLVLWHHDISHIAIVFVFFIAPNVCTYFCPFLFPLLAFPLFQVFFVILKILLLFHVCKCFFFMFLLSFCFANFLCKFLCLQFWISSFIFKQCNVIFFLLYFLFHFCVYSIFFSIFVMSTIDEASRKKLCNEGSIGKNVLEILKEILSSSSFLSKEFLTLWSLSSFTFYYTILDYYVFVELLWSINGDDMYVQCIELHSSNVVFSIDKPLANSI